MTENLALKAANLYSEGNSFGKISKEMGVSKSRVGDLIREGIFAMANHDGNPDEIPVVHVEGEQENEPMSEEPFVTIYEDDSDLNEIWEKTLLIQATPILRKVVLNSKVFLQHEYFQKHLGYVGDIGDLLVEALNFYWKEMGFTIKITHDSVV